MYRALAERARQQLAECPHCRQPVRGHDNPNCHKALTSLLLPAPRAGFDRRVPRALGALGVLVGVTLATTAEPNG